MPKIVCPYCFEEFNRSEVMFRCTNDECEKEVDSAMSKFWGQNRKKTPAIENQPGFMDKLLDKMPNSAVCDKCGHKTFTVICPHCHNMIPKEMVEHKGYIISIIGARSSGKTNYITVLIDQLRKYGSKLGNLGVLASTVADEYKDCTQVRYQTDFYDVLFKKGVLPAQTQIDDPKSKIPLIYTITQKGVKHPLHLVFYDTAGENFDDPNTVRKNVKFLDKSDAFIFILDTFKVPYIHDALNLTDDIKPRYDKIFSSVYTVLREDLDKLKERMNKPMAFAFSKIDAILDNSDKLEYKIPGMNIEANSSYLDGGGINIAELNEISNAFEGDPASPNDHGVLGLWDEGTFLGNVNNFKNHKFFGFSALGKNPGNSNSITGIRPYRVLDPLVWILDQLHYPLLKQK